ncbi:uncharacterized protein RJT20DRAFT_129452 [Scheffersomyces xylosifermentans]|uniref:uncharacterized protein n=1 Tax=Scheffersomyces xylosifermentans TaxID=1304137 RepID=UPI00315CF765
MESDHNGSRSVFERVLSLLGFLSEQRSKQKKVNLQSDEISISRDGGSDQQKHTVKSISLAKPLTNLSQNQDQPSGSRKSTKISSNSNDKKINTSRSFVRVHYNKNANGSYSNNSNNNGSDSDSDSDTYSTSYSMPTILVLSSGPRSRKKNVNSQRTPVKPIGIYPDEGKQLTLSEKIIRRSMKNEEDNSITPRNHGLLSKTNYPSIASRSYSEQPKKRPHSVLDKANTSLPYNGQSSPLPLSERLKRRKYQDLSLSERLIMRSTPLKTETPKMELTTPIQSKIKKEKSHQQNSQTRIPLSERLQSRVKKEVSFSQNVMDVEDSQVSQEDLQEVVQENMPLSERLKARYSNNHLTTQSPTSRKRTFGTALVTTPTNKASRIDRSSTTPLHYNGNALDREAEPNSNKENIGTPESQLAHNTEEVTDIRWSTPSPVREYSYQNSFIELSKDLPIRSRNGDDYKLLLPDEAIPSNRDLVPVGRPDDLNNILNTTNEGDQEDTKALPVHESVHGKSLYDKPAIDTIHTVPVWVESRSRKGRVAKRRAHIVPGSAKSSRVFHFVDPDSDQEQFLIQDNPQRRKGEVVVSKNTARWIQHSSDDDDLPEGTQHEPCHVAENKKDSGKENDEREADKVEEMVKNIVENSIMRGMHDNDEGKDGNDYPEMNQKETGPSEPRQEHEYDNVYDPVSDTIQSGQIIPRKEQLFLDSDSTVPESPQDLNLVVKADQGYDSDDEPDSNSDEFTPKHIKVEKQSGYSSVRDDDTERTSPPRPDDKSVQGDIIDQVTGRQKNKNKSRKLGKQRKKNREKLKEKEKMIEVKNRMKMENIINSQSQVEVINED